MAGITSPIRIGSTERQLRSLELRKLGCTYEEIGRELCVSDVQAYRLCRKALTRLQQAVMESAQEWQTLELQKLDQQEADVCRRMGLATDAQYPKLAELRLRIIAQRCKLLGLTQPTQVNQVVVAQVDSRLADVLNSPVVQQLAERAVRETTAEVIEVTPQGER